MPARLPLQRLGDDSEPFCQGRSRRPLPSFEQRLNVGHDPLDGLGAAAALGAAAQASRPKSRVITRDAQERPHGI
jgi:hypothetical protein